MDLFRRMDEEHEAAIKEARAAEYAAPVLHSPLKVMSPLGQEQQQSTPPPPPPPPAAAAAVTTTTTTSSSSSSSPKQAERGGDVNTLTASHYDFSSPSLPLLLHPSAPPRIPREGYAVLLIVVSCKGIFCLSITISFIFLRVQFTDCGPAGRGVGPRASSGRDVRGHVGTALPSGYFARWRRLRSIVSLQGREHRHQQCDSTLQCSQSELGVLHCPCCAAVGWTECRGARTGSRRTAAGPVNPAADHNNFIVHVKSCCAHVFQRLKRW